MPDSAWWLSESQRRCKGAASRGAILDTRLGSRAKWPRQREE